MSTISDYLKYLTSYAVWSTSSYKKCCPYDVWDRRDTTMSLCHYATDRFAYDEEHWWAGLTHRVSPLYKRLFFIIISFHINKESFVESRNVMRKSRPPTSCIIGGTVLIAYRKIFTYTNYSSLTSSSASALTSVQCNYNLYTLLTADWWRCDMTCCLPVSQVNNNVCTRRLRWDY